MSYTSSRRPPSSSSLFQFQNGIYQGELFDSKRSGFGVYYWDNGQIYLGQWKDDFINGIGTVFFGLGGQLYGQFKKNKLHGPGVVVLGNGDIYAGRWKKGKLEGKCVNLDFEKKEWKFLRYYSGLRVEVVGDSEGILVEFEKIKGEIITGSNFEYKEYFYSFPFANMLKEKGYNYAKDKAILDFLTFEDDTWFYGICYNSAPHGLGICGQGTLLSQRGVFQNGVLHGLGRMFLPNGDVYDGIFEEGNLFLGLVYFEKENSFVFGQWEEGGRRRKIFTEGIGWPINFSSVGKHGIYRSNYSFFYRYTALEVVYLSEMEKWINKKYPNRKYHVPPKRIGAPQKTQTDLIETSNENSISIPNTSPTRSRSFLSHSESIKAESVKRNSPFETTVKKKYIFDHTDELRDTVKNFMETVDNWESNENIEFGLEENRIGDVKVWNNCKVEGIPSFSNLNVSNDNCIHNYKVEKLNTLDSMFKNERSNRSSPNNEDAKKIKNGVFIYYDDESKNLNSQNFYFEPINLFQKEANNENKVKVKVLNVS